MAANSILPGNYSAVLDQIKQRVRVAQIRAVLASNHELIQLYWDIGRAILQQQKKQGWGAQVIERLASDLRRSFPDMPGFSLRNLKYMPAFSDAWPERSIVQRPVGPIPRGHSVGLSGPPPAPRTPV